MPSPTTVAIGVGLAALTCACGSTTTTVTAGPILPLRTLRLYETGVGYFERSGPLTGDRAALPVPAAHLDDALESLVVLSAGGRSVVQGIEFGSSVTRGMARALAGLPVDGDEPLGLQQLLMGLKGAAVEVHAQRAGAQTGRIVDVVVAREDGVTAKQAPDTDKPEAQPREAPSALTVLLLTDHGAIVRIPAAEIDSVRPLDPGYARRLGSTLDALSTHGAQSDRLLQVLAHTAAGGPVTLGYIAETPVWRSTYRLLFDAPGKPALLQGWALLHNDTDEDWHGVRVELANGRPDSFLFPLAAPRYARRPLVTPDEQLATVPQLLGTTVDAIWGEQVGDASGSGGLGLTGVGEGGGGYGYGYGYGHGKLGGSHTTVQTSDVLEVGNLASAAPAVGTESGALFVYTLPGPVDLHAHASTLVPFAQQQVDATPISWVDSSGSPARSAVRFVNTTSQTLPAGTLALFADGGFAGESSLPRLKPGERRFMTYGADLDVALTTVDSRATEETKHLVWDRGARRLEEHYLRTSDFTYSIENRSVRPRSVFLVMTLDRNATLTGPDSVDFDTDGARPLAVFQVPAGKSVERKAHAVEGLARVSPLASLTAQRLEEMAASPALASTERAAVSEAATRLHEAEDDAKSAAQATADIAEVEKDVERLREHMKAVSGERAAGGAANPFAARVLAAEDRLTALRRRVATLEADGKTRREAAQATLAKLPGRGG